MKDLKHLMYFENLLLDSKNELIEQAQGEEPVDPTLEVLPDEESW